MREEASVMVSNLNVRPVVDPKSESKQTFHHWMKRFQAATLGLVVGVFVMALWVSINWKQAAPFEVAFWWMSFALSGIPLTIFVGLDIIFAQGAVIPVQWGSGPKRMVTVTGRKAILTGLGIIAAALAWGGFVLALMVAALSYNWDMLRVTISIFSAMLGVVIVLKILSSLVRDLSRTRAK
jgi:hypothetical protein